MPIERRSTRSQTTTVVVALTSVAAVALVVFLLIRAASTGDGVALNLGVDRFEAGNAEERAAAIATTGIPLLFSDVSGNGQQRPIFLNHTGDDATVGWSAFDARPPGGSADCFLEWDESKEDFTGVDGCDTRRFPATGEGLTSYPWKVNDAGQLIVDLKPDDGK